MDVPHAVFILELKEKKCPIVFTINDIFLNATLSF